MDDRSKNVAMYAAAGALAGLAAWQFFAGGKRQSGLRGQVVVITGGSRGLGLQLARDFAAHGCRVAICARTGEDLEVAADDLKSRGAEVLAMECDVRSRTEVEQFIEAVRTRFGRVDVLVNNAGIIQVGPIESMEIEDFEEAMDIMFWGVLYPIWSALPHMLDRGRGRIVNITSIGGKVSVPHLVPYSCAKFAAVALSEGLRTELGPKGIQVLTVVPGLMRTGSFLNALFKGKQEDEFTWFGLSAAAPGISMDVERASSQIIRAMRAGRSEHILTAPAQILARLHGAFPELTTALMTAVNQYILPSAAGGSREAVSGEEADRKLDSPLFRFLTALGRMAADRMNERVQHA
jgi:NAD(P)-dependent dehydrogenase (short-subunit alcohol dehydrogenase family)